jgi:hypothetical protein
MSASLIENKSVDTRTWPLLHASSPLCCSPLVLILSRCSLSSLSCESLEELLSELEAPEQKNQDTARVQTEIEEANSLVSGTTDNAVGSRWMQLTNNQSSSLREN